MKLNISKTYIYIAVSSLMIVLITGCRSNSTDEKGSPVYIKEINKWHSERISNLKEEDGWLNLVGLYWLKQGENTFGSDKSNNIIFPSNAPAFIGLFILADSIVTIKIKGSMNVKLGDSTIVEMEMQNDLSGNPTILSLGDFRWNIIRRGDKYGIRLRDLNADLVKKFEGVERYPVNVDWKIKAKYEGYNESKKISIPTIIGTTEEEFSPGILYFKINGKKFSLEPMDAGKSFFVIFADETNGDETYGAGRFLTVDKPDSPGNTFIDFNKAYNPPCAFTKYATCPLPPKENYIKTKITAGEKNYGEGH